MEICPNNQCTGCFACARVCPRQAINKSADRHGFFRPAVNESLCIHCNKCISTCPSLNPVSLQSPKIAYACVDESRKRSTSGGIAMTLYRYITGRGGTCLGVSYKPEKHQFELVQFNTLDEAMKCAGSKYCQPSCFEVMTQAQLHNNLPLLVVGSPCQIAAWRRVLDNRDNAFFVDIVCHGVPSIQMLQDDMRKNKISLHEVDDFAFRERDKYRLIAYSKGDAIYRAPSSKNAYLEAFQKGLSLSQACLECKYAGSKRAGDITLGDYWGLGQDCHLYGKTPSLVMVNSDKGAWLFDQIKEQIVYEERPLSEAITGNAQLRFPIGDTKFAAKFRRLYPARSFGVAVRKSRTWPSQMKRVLLFWRRKQ